MERSGFTDARLAIGGEVYQLWRARESESIKEFRYRQRERRADLDWLVNQQIIKGADGAGYKPTLLLHAALYAFRRKSAIAVHAVLEASYQAAKRIRSGSPHLESVSLQELRSKVNSGHEESLLRDVLTFCDPSCGIYLTGESRGHVAITEHLDASPDFLTALHKFVDMRLRLTQFLFPVVDFSDASHVATLTSVPAAHESAIKAMNHIRTEPDAAITSARSALEALLKFVAHQEGIELAPSASIGQMMAACRQPLVLDGMFMDLARAVTSVVNAVFQLRNALGDSHGRAPGDRRATPSEARLVVMSSVALAVFLLERWESGRLLTAPQGRAIADTN